MILEGVVTNVAAFGAFVDVGVHQDGLVHVSAMAERFVSDPHEVVKSGQVVRVKVLEVDVDRQRIGLSLRLNDDAAADRGKRPDRPAAARGAVTTKVGVTSAEWISESPNQRQDLCSPRRPPGSKPAGWGIGSSVT